VILIQTATRYLYAVIKLKIMKKLVFTLMAAIALKSNAQQLVRANGNVQLVTTANTKIVINGGITFLGTSSITSTADSIYLYNYSGGTAGNWLDSTLSGAMITTSTGNVFFNGTVRQSFYGKTRFYNLFVRNTNGDTLLSSCEVRNILHLDTGFVYTKSGYGNDSLLVSNSAIAAVVSTSNFTKSWVNGRLSRIANVTATIIPPTPYANSYFFPVGKTDSLYAPVQFAKFNTNPTTWTAEYFDGLPFNYTNIQSPPIDHLSRMEYWELTSNASSGPDDDAYVSLSWRGHSKVSSSAAVRDSLLVAQYIVPPSQWSVPGGWATGRISAGSDSLQGYVTNNTSSMAFDFTNRRFTLATFSKYNALPLTLLYFTALADGNKVRLNWDVANEENTMYYDVEKSLTGTGFSHLLTRTSLQQSRSQYTDYDYAPATGWNFYRIKMVDRSGNFTYSPVRAVKFDKGLEEVKIFPNPATTVLNIQLPSSYAGKVTLQVYGADGKYISSMKPTVNSIQLNVLPLPAGTYILKMTKDNGDVITYPFVKQ